LIDPLFLPAVLPARFGLVTGGVESLGSQKGHPGAARPACLRGPRPGVSHSSQGAKERNMEDLFFANAELWVDFNDPGWPDKVTAIARHARPDVQLAATV
jgi:hypothetical protein